MRSGYGAACAGKASARNFRPARAVRERRPQRVLRLWPGAPPHPFPGIAAIHLRRHAPASGVKPGPEYGAWPEDTFRRNMLQTAQATQSWDTIIPRGHSHDGNALCSSSVLWIRKKNFWSVLLLKISAGQNLCSGPQVLRRHRRSAPQVNCGDTGEGGRRGFSLALLDSVEHFISEMF